MLFRCILGPTVWRYDVAPSPLKLSHFDPFKQNFFCKITLAPFCVSNYTLRSFESYFRLPSASATAHSVRLLLQTPFCVSNCTLRSFESYFRLPSALATPHSVLLIILPFCVSNCTLRSFETSPYPSIIFLTIDLPSYNMANNYLFDALIPNSSRICNYLINV